MTIKKIAGKKVKFIDDGELHICMEQGRYIDENGKMFIKVKWFKTDQEVDLGSMKEPNKEILKVRYMPPKKEGGNLPDMFKGLFGK